jgi:hypothetical protein
MGQWTYYSRKQNLLKYAGCPGWSTYKPCPEVWQFSTQLGFLYWELRTTSMWDSLRSFSGNDETAVGAATEYFERNFENPKYWKKTFIQRRNEAIRVFERYRK